MQRVRIDDDGGGVLDDGPDGVLRATARTRHHERWLATPRSDGTAAASDARIALLGPLVARAAAEGVAAVHWETDDDAIATDAVAGALGLDERRDVLQLRRPLPLEADLVAATTPVAVRPLRPGTADEQAWVRCNNRSFAGHPDQGAETVATLHAAMAEPWFDASGFLLADGDPGVDAGGGLDGFCWTKVHPAAGQEPARGEIYVIGIDPDAAGRSLGRSLTVAGLAHLAGTGLTGALLYVDADNAPARHLYDRLGFTLHRTRRIRSRRTPQVTE